MEFNTVHCCVTEWSIWTCTSLSERDLPPVLGGFGLFFFFLIVFGVCVCLCVPVYVKADPCLGSKHSLVLLQLFAVCLAVVITYCLFVLFYDEKVTHYLKSTSFPHDFSAYLSKQYFDSIWWFTFMPAACVLNFLLTNLDRQAGRQTVKHALSLR